MLLDAQAEPDARAKILQDTRKAIAAKGEVVRDDDWGDRSLAYPIGRKADAEYHLLQFRASTPELPGELERTLRITDGVVRFRIVKLKPGTPDAPDMRGGAGATRARHAETHAAAPATPTSGEATPVTSPPGEAALGTAETRAEPPTEAPVSEPA
jgi:small subunit ribosomal protein S6